MVGAPRRGLPYRRGSLVGAPPLQGPVTPRRGCVSPVRSRECHERVEVKDGAVTEEVNKSGVCRRTTVGPYPIATPRPVSGYGRESLECQVIFQETPTLPERP